MAIQEDSTTHKQRVDYYTGYITEVIDPVLYQIKVCIPGVFDEITAFPMRGDNTEPRVGDFVLLISFDPIYHSFFLYQHLKENDFIGFRSNGKQIDVTPDYIEISIFDPETEWGDGKKAEEDGKYRPEAMHWVKLDKDGNLDVALNGSGANLTITASGDQSSLISGKYELEVSGNISIKTDGNCNIEVKGSAEIVANSSAKIESPQVEINSSGTITLHGGGMLQTDAGTPVAPGAVGPFCGLPACVFSGAPHLATQVSGV